MHYYQFNIGDYASHTKGLSLYEDIAYRRMMDEYYLSEQALNGCSTDVARCIGMREQQQEVDYILQRFFKNEDGKWTHRRIEKEINEFHAGKESKSKAGKASAEARRIKALEQTLEQNPTGVEQALNSVELTKNQEPRTKNQEPDIKPTSKPSVPTCPTEKIIELFKSKCPSLVQPRIVTDSTKGMIGDRWRQDPKHQELAFWEKYFDYCESLHFLAGRTSPNPSHSEKAFRVGLEWIVKSGNFAKIINGNFANA